MNQAQKGGDSREHKQPRPHDRRVWLKKAVGRSSKQPVLRTCGEKVEAKMEKKVDTKNPKIVAWRAVMPPRMPEGHVVVTLDDGRTGLLTVDYANAFDGAEQWLTLDIPGGADGTGACRVGASDIDMSADLRKQVLRMSLRAVASGVADELAQDRSEIPEFGAYVSAEGLAAGGYDEGSLAMNLIPWLEEIAERDDRDADELSVPALKRLAGEAKKVWRNGNDTESAASQGL